MVWLMSLIVGIGIVIAIIYRYKSDTRSPTRLEKLLAVVGLGFVLFSAYAANSRIGSPLFEPTAGTFDWYLTHDEDRSRKVIDCNFAAPAARPQMECGPAEKAAAQIEKEKSDREADALFKRK